MTPPEHAFPQKSAAPKDQVAQSKPEVCTPVVAPPNSLLLLGLSQCDPTSQSCLDTASRTSREEALQQCYLEDKSFFPFVSPPNVRTPTAATPSTASAATSSPGTATKPWDIGLRNEHIPIEGYRGPLRPIGEYTKPYARMYAEQGNYEAAELAEHYMCPTCHVLTHVRPSEFSLRGYTTAYRENYKIGQMMIGSAAFALAAPEVAAVVSAWETGVNTTEAAIGRTSGAHVMDVATGIVTGDYDAGKSLSTGQRISAGVNAGIGLLGMAASVMGASRQPSGNPFANLTDAEIDSAIGAMSSQYRYRIPRSVSEAGIPLETLTPASRWGRSGLRPGDWVMNGPPSKGNYVMSFKWDPNPMNIRAPFVAGEGYMLPPQQVRWPSGWGLDGWWKGLFGQRRYIP